MGKFKRELVPGTYLTAADMLSLLSQQQYKAVAAQGRIILAVQPPVAWQLDSCCVGRATMQWTAPMAVPLSGSSAGDTAGRREAELAAAVLAVTGLNTADEALWQQFRQHQQQVRAAQQRRASRGKRAAAAAAAAAIGPAEWEQQQAADLKRVCLVQLSCQEAVFISRVLGCCQVWTVEGSSDSTCSVNNEQQGVYAADRPQIGSGAAVQQQQQGGGGGASGSSPPVLLSGSALWRWCCQHTTGGAGVFAPQYAAYHHLRSLGWLPLPGLAYGADYVLYQLHPELAHSDFVVTVMVEGNAREGAVGGAAAAGAGQPGRAAAAAGAAGQQAAAADTGQGPLQQPHQQAQEPLPSTQLAWLDACIMHRLARQVLKEMMLLYVVVPAGVSLLEFECIDSFQVREVLVQRWVPSEHRELGK